MKHDERKSGFYIFPIEENVKTNIHRAVNKNKLFASNFMMALTKANPKAEDYSVFLPQLFCSELAHTMHKNLTPFSSTAAQPGDIIFFDCRTNGSKIISNISEKMDQGIPGSAIFTHVSIISPQKIRIWL